MNKKNILLQGIALCVLLQIGTYCYADPLYQVDRKETCLGIDKLSYEEGKGWIVTDLNWSVKSQDATRKTLSQSDIVKTSVEPYGIFYPDTEGVVECDYNQHTVVLTRKYLVGNGSKYLVGTGAGNTPSLSAGCTIRDWKGGDTECSSLASSLNQCQYSFVSSVCGDDGMNYGMMIPP